MIIFFHVTPPTEPFSLSLHDALPLTIRSVGADLSYDITEINAKAGTQFTLEYANESNMPHNMVFVNSEADINPVGIAALQALETEYIPKIGRASCRESVTSTDVRR